MELHRHLEGSVRFETFVDIAREAKIELPARDPRRLRKLVCAHPSDPRTLPAFLSKFLLRRNLYPNRASIERVAREAMEDAARDGIEHLELRFSPVHFARRMNADAAECAGWIIRAARRAASCSVKFIITLARDFPVRDNEPSLEAALAHRGDVVALDVAGDERRPLRPLMPLLERGLREALKLTVHAGEGRGPASVREAIEIGANRLGHGVRAVHDPALLDEILRRRIGLEFCPTSNLQTGAWRRIETHPLKRLLRAGHLVTINTDDPRISGIDLVHEFRAARRMGLRDAELRSLVDHAIEAAFLSAAEKRSLRRRVRAAAL
ncbi:MAG: adenosine deaminase [Planctomycetes bacterium]|nr:adenosine deaminase [Planctomycetota bacterium]